MIIYINIEPLNRTNRHINGTKNVDLTDQMDQSPENYVIISCGSRMMRTMRYRHVVHLDKYC